MLMETKEKETIKDTYKDLLEVAELNHPDYYMMPKTFYNSIAKKIQYLDRALVNARKSNENLRKKMKEMKNDK